MTAGPDSAEHPSESGAHVSSSGPGSTSGQPTSGNHPWLLTLLPAFPLVLLVLRLWFLSRQDLPTMLLLVQYVSPLGMVSALVITLVWAAPVVVLAVRALGSLLDVSDPSCALPGSRPWLVRVSHRIPGWVVAVAVGLAALTWQLRFLPILLMITVAVTGLMVRNRYRHRPGLVRVVCVVIPVCLAVGACVWLGPAIVQALRTGELVTGLLLLVPPVLSVLLTGPIPSRSARMIIQWPAIVAAVLAPFLIGAIFIRSPILPTVAVEVAPESGSGAARVVLGNIITVDDRMTTLLDSRGIVLFVRNDDIQSKTLCPLPDQAPTGMVQVHGWYVEQSALGWIAPVRRQVAADPRCEGRPLVVRR